MRLESVHLHGIGPFDDYTLDLSELGEARIVAIVGPNGAGKSTLLEAALPGSIYRDTPTRGSLVSLATARDSFIESRIVNGKAWTMRHSLDAVSGKGEALVLDESGAPVLPDTKVRSFDAWAAQTFPEQAVTLSSVFGSQAGDGFLGAKPGARKAVLLRILGVERLERLAEQARERARTAGHEFEVVTARLTELGDVDVEAAEAAVGAAHNARTEAEEALVAAREELETARTQLAEAQRVEERNAEQRLHRSDLATRIDKAKLDITAAEAQLDRAKAEVRDLDAKIRNNRKVLEQRDEIEAAVRRRDELATEIANAEGQLRTLSADAESLRKEQGRLEREESAATKRAAQHRQRAERLRKEFERSEKGVEAAKVLPEREAELEAAKSEQTAAERRLEELRGQQLLGAGERIAQLRYGLEVIATDETANAQAIARGELEADDRAVELAATLPKDLQAAHDCVSKARGQVGDAEVALRACRELAALAGRIEADRRELEEVGEQIDAEDRAAHDSRQQLDEIGTRHLALGDQRETADRNLGRLQDELVRLKDLLDLKAPLALAEQRIADRTAQREEAIERVREAEARLDAARNASTDLQGQLAASPEPEATPSAPTAREVATLQERVGACETAARSAHASVSVAARTLEDTQAAAARAEGLEVEKRQIEADLADWKRLAADLGREGLQAAEIDAAGPELTTLVNDLLHTAHGPRWTVTIETQRLSADGKRTLEGCEVRVLDVERGRDTTAETLSGGERVIVGEAVSLALSMLACRRAGMDRPTLVRDESGAALDGDAARAYVSMLRRAAEIVNADRVLIVSHTPEVWAMCDAEVRLH